MPGSPHPSLVAVRSTRRTRLVGKVARYTGGSVIAAVCSELAFVLMYGVVHATPVWSSGVGWLAGALPNYWLNRSWTWRQRGRPSLRHEVLPYVAIIVATVVLAMVVTHAVDGWLQGSAVSSGVRVMLVAGAFLGVYVAMFLLRFFLLDRMFARLDRVTAGGPAGSAPR